MSKSSFKYDNGNSGFRPSEEECNRIYGNIGRKKNIRLNKKQIPTGNSMFRNWPKYLNKDFRVVYSTRYGHSILGSSRDILESSFANLIEGKVQLVFTSPPFPLNRGKKYGNLKNEPYKTWLRGYAQLLKKMLTPDGSIVIEIGNVWESGLPVMSTLVMETLLEFKNAAGLYLCQEFIWYNPAKLPTPAHWVSVTRSRVKDAFTRLWWLSPTPYPKSDNRKVLVPYSPAMIKLLRSKKYISGIRPSEHRHSPVPFLNDNGGAIPPNVLFASNCPESLIISSNTKNSEPYRRFCKNSGLSLHPAKMPIDLAKFFISLCTDAGDIVLDPFGGSNTTGAASEELGRKWITIEINKDYAEAGQGHFRDVLMENEQE